jgi:carboxylesterase type B
MFKNIRFAAPPLGQLRWAKPAPPLKQDGIQQDYEGRACIQSTAGRSRPGMVANEGEDCLYLDVTVPGEIIRNSSSAKVPVVDWIHGGAYVGGSKEQRGNAEVMVRASKANLIWVAANYRVGHPLRLITYLLIS